MVHTKQDVRSVQEWAEFAHQLAQEVMQTDVDPPHREEDVEIEGEWCLLIVIRSHGSVEETLAGWEALSKRFTSEVPTEARDRIRFEMVLED